MSTNKGIIKKTASDGANFMSKISANPSKAVSLNFDVSYSYLESQSYAQGSHFDPIKYAYFANPYEKLYNDDGSYRADETYFAIDLANGSLYNILPDNGVNVMREIDNTDLQSTSSSLTLRGDVTWHLGEHFRLYGLAFPDYDDFELTCTVLLDTLTTESPALTREQQQLLYERVMDDYADIPLKSDRLKRLRQDRYYNALQVKFAYAVTCHKAQGGQWAHVYVDLGYMTDDMLTPRLPALAVHRFHPCHPPPLPGQLAAHAARRPGLSSHRLPIGNKKTKNYAPRAPFRHKQLLHSVLVRGIVAKNLPPTYPLTLPLFQIMTP